ncbi:hypothetical protein ACFL2Q_14940 [Thermodesulfobacteriota bacterium]
MDFSEMADWLEFKCCNDCRQGYTCQEEECSVGTEVAGIMRKMSHFCGTDSSGKSVCGFFIPE